MAQIKIFGLREQLDPIKQKLSRAIHQCVVETLQLPQDKRAHRFFPMEKEDFFAPAGRTDAYIIIEISLMEGRKKETKKKLIRLLFERIRDEVGIQHQDVEVCISESPACNWGFRGMHGDEITLDYKVNV